MKTKKLLTTIAMALAVLIVACKKDTFVEKTAVCPKVVSTDPANGATLVPSNQVIRVVFNEPMNPATINQSSFSLFGASQVSGLVTYDPNTYTMSFMPSSPLMKTAQAANINSTYTARVISTVKDMMGNALQTDYVWTFSTGASLSPTITSTNPANNAKGVPTNKVVKAVFSEAMDPSTINGTTYFIMQGVTNIGGTVSYADDTAFFTPSPALVIGKTYTATITTGAKDPSGFALNNNYTWTFTAGVDLQSAARFGIIAGTGIMNNAGPSVINNMDVGISPGIRASVTGFNPPATIVNGTIYASDDAAPPGVAAMLTKAKQDLTNAFTAAQNATMPAPATVSGDQGGLTLNPGIYKSGSTLLIQSGNLTLDALGDSNAVWIFQVGSDFTSVGGAGGSVLLSNGALAKNIYWQVGNSATIGDNTTFQGNVMALTSITMNSGAVATGRMLAINGDVVMTSTNIINKP